MRDYQNDVGKITGGEYAHFLRKMVDASGIFPDPDTIQVRCMDKLVGEEFRMLPFIDGAVVFSTPILDSYRNQNDFHGPKVTLVDGGNPLQEGEKEITIEELLLRDIAPVSIRGPQISAILGKHGDFYVSYSRCIGFPGNDYELAVLEAIQPSVERPVRGYSITSNGYYGVALRSLEVKFTMYKVGGHERPFSDVNRLDELLKDFLQNHDGARIAMQHIAKEALVHRPPINERERTAKAIHFLRTGQI